jgi:outer membrane PBP1 activator LpoA protein
MSFRKMKSGPGTCAAFAPHRLVMAAVLAGLCALAQANTTAYPAEGLLLAQNDISLMPGGPVETESVPAPDIATQPQDQVAGPSASGAVRIGLLLPLRSESLRTAAAMVRDGFVAAYEKSRDPGVSLTVVETGDAAQDVLDAYTGMLPDVDIMVGPLSRSGAAAIAKRGAINKPTIALTPADAVGDNGAMPQLLPMGLSLEDDARQAADWAATDQPGETALVVSTATTWQRRAARAFQAAWQRRGLRAELFELSAAGGNLSASALAQLQERLRGSRPGLVFAALDAAQARQLRESIGADLPMYGTSQLNPFTSQAWAGVDARNDMNGVRFIDLPWLLRPDSAASAGYARPAGATEQSRSADMERLYALGIDAYAVARGVAAQRGVFDVDGATGRLKVSIGAGPARFERSASPAVYQDGIAAPMPGTP